MNGGSGRRRFLARLGWYSAPGSFGGSLLRHQIHDLAIERGSADDRGLKAVARMVGIATIWTATEWLRCNTVSEFPWLPVGCTQSSLVVMCQIADFAGVWGITFWVLLVNALVTIAWLHRGNAHHICVPGFTIAAGLMLIAGYGTCAQQTTPEQSGPRIMLLQSNHPHVRGGASTTSPDVAAKFFLSELKAQLRRNVSTS